MYGLVVSANINGKPLTYNENKVESGANSIKIDMSDANYSKLTVKVSNVASYSLHCCGYVSMGGEIAYLNHETVDATAKTVSLETIDAMLNPTTPPVVDEE